MWYDDIGLMLDALLDSLNNNLYFLYQFMNRQLYQNESCKEVFDCITLGVPQELNGPSYNISMSTQKNWWHPEEDNYGFLTSTFGESDTVQEISFPAKGADTIDTIDAPNTVDTAEITIKDTCIKEHYLMAYYGCIHVLQDLNDEQYRRAIIHGIITNTNFAAYVFRMERQTDSHNLCQFCVSAFLNHKYYKRQWVETFTPGTSNLEQLYHKCLLDRESWSAFRRLQISQLASGLSSDDDGCKNENDFIKPEINVIYYASLRKAWNETHCSIYNNLMSSAKQLGFVYQMLNRDTLEYLDEPLKLPLSVLDEMEGMEGMERIKRLVTQEVRNELYEQEMISRLQKLNTDRGADPFPLYGPKFG